MVVVQIVVGFVKGNGATLGEAEAGMQALGTGEGKCSGGGDGWAMGSETQIRQMVEEEGSRSRALEGVACGDRCRCNNEGSDCGRKKSRRMLKMSKD